MIRGTSSGADDVIGNGKCVLSGHLREAIWMIASNKAGGFFSTPCLYLPCRWWCRGPCLCTGVVVGGRPSSGKAYTAPPHCSPHIAATKHCESAEKNGQFNIEKQNFLHHPDASLLTDRNNVLHKCNA